MSAMTGQCLCGAVKFKAEVASTDHGACHCGMCRRWSGGSPFMAVATTGVTFEGEANVARFASSEWAERGFCKLCGSNLFYFLKPRQMYAMSAGTFDDAQAFRVVREIFIDQKPDGYALAGDHPRLTEAETLAAFKPPPPAG
jgi:hypothetical protein